MLEMDAQDQIADAVGRFLDEDGRQPAQKASGDAEQQHELLVGQVGSTPRIKTLYPLAELLLRHGSFVFKPLK